MKIITFGPEKDGENSWKLEMLEKAFESMKLVDKTVVLEYVVYVFDDNVIPRHI